MGMLSLDGGWHCVYATRFDPVPAGPALVEVANQWGYRLACTDTYVSAGQTAPANLSQYGYFCR